MRHYDSRYPGGELHDEVAPAPAPGRSTLTSQIQTGRERTPVQLAPQAPVAHDPEQSSWTAVAFGDYSRLPVQLRANGEGGSAADPVGAARAGLAGAAQPLPHLDRIQTAFGGHDVSGVRAQVGGAAAGACDSLGATAYAHDGGVGFASSPDLHTAAHEAAHVVQQRAGVQLKAATGEVGDSYERHADAVADAVVRGDSAQPLLDGVAGGGAPSHDAVQRVANDAGAAKARAMIVADGEPVESGQVAMTAFLDQLRAAVTARASAVLGPTWSASGCQDIPKMFAHYASLDAATVDRIMRRYSGVASPSSAADYIAPICARIGGAIRRWDDGEALSWDVGSSGLPSALDSAPAATPAAPGAVVQLKQTGAGDASGGVGLADLGASSALDAGTAARMGTAMGERFDDVRVHTDATAAQTARGLGADALAVGSHVAFAPGAYQPGTPSGDGLIAHELAHVVQQRGATPLVQRRAASVESSSAHERDADHVADAVVARLHGGEPGTAPIRPSLSAGLGVQRGNRSSKDKPSAPRSEPPAVIHEPEPPSAEETRDAVRAACITAEDLAVERMHSRKPFDLWQPDQIRGDARLRDEVHAVVDDDAMDRAIRELRIFRHCATDEAAKKAIKDAYDARHPDHAPREMVLAPARVEPAKLRTYTSRYYDRDYTGQAALIASIIRTGAEYVAASYSRDQVDVVINQLENVDPPDLTADQILADKNGDYFKRVVAAYNAQLDRTSGTKGFGTQIGNATGAHYSGVMKI